MALTLRPVSHSRVGQVMGNGPVIGYEVVGLPYGEKAQIDDMGPPKHWRLMRHVDHFSSESDGHATAEAALAALEKDVVTPGMTFSGSGELWVDGERVVGDMPYTIHVSADRQTRAMVELDRVIGSKIINSAGPNTDLILKLADGRRWPCIIAVVHPNDRAELLSRGPILR